MRFVPRCRSLPGLRRLPACLALAAAVACTSTALVNPAPIPAASTPSRTRAAVLRAVVRSHWQVVSEKPGEVVARLDRGAWEMVVAIDYGDRVAIRYVSSRGLDYDDSSRPPRIHGGYNKRVKRLMDLIAQEVTLQGIPDS